jgi:phosphoserine phosphatase RsbU/P
VTINIPSAYDDPRFSAENDRRSGFTTRSILCMPLFTYSGEVVGVIQALNKHNGQAFGAYDEQVLSALCSQAGVAIDNAQLVAAELDHQRLARELEIAATIQAGLLPDIAPSTPGWRFSAFAQPCDETGGDYFDYLLHADGIDVVVGDVTGHGIGAALLMSTARAFLRALHTVVPDDLGELVTRFNSLLEQDMAEDTFLSLVACRLGKDGHAAYVAAGHEAPLVWRAATKTFDTLESTGLLLGVLADEVYVERALPPLQRGDLVLLFTDGLWECTDPSGQAFGLDRLREVIAQASDRGAEGVRDAVVKASLAHLGGAAPLDDLTLVVGECC